MTTDGLFCGEMRYGRSVTVEVDGLHGIPLTVDKIHYLHTEVNGRRFALWDYYLKGRAEMQGAQYADESGRYVLRIRHVPAQHGEREQTVLLWYHDGIAAPDEVNDFLRTIPGSGNFRYIDTDGALVGDFQCSWPLVVEYGYHTVQRDSMDPAAQGSNGRLCLYHFYGTAEEESGSYTQLLFVDYCPDDETVETWIGHEINASDVRMI